MPKIKTVKLIFYFTALLLIAKPFVGFGLFGHINSPVRTNIFVKIFSKRKLESSQCDSAAIQQQLAEPVTNLFLRVSFFLAILFPFAFNFLKAITTRFLREILLNILPRQLTLFTGQLLI
jgi:hypothetical protein